MTESPTTTTTTITENDDKNNNVTTTTTTPKIRSALDEVSKDGAFQRKDAAWRNWISREEGAKFPPETNRYHLFVAYACPWAHRTLITRALKGLEDVISITVVLPVWAKTKPNVDNDEHAGWIFANPNGEPYKNIIGLGGPFPTFYENSKDNTPEPFYNSYSIRELYEHANDTDGKYSVPILWDKQLKTIVSNESSEIIRMLNTEFNEYAKNPTIDLYPKELQKEIDNVNEWVYPTINNGVYRCGFAKTQNAYDIAINELTKSFDRIEEILTKQRYIAGNTFTEADIRLFVTLLRFDEVYIVYFKCNTRSVLSTSTILNYCRDIYQLPGVADTVNMEQIKTHYFASHPTLNHYSIIPKGIDFISKLKEKHNRNELFDNNTTSNEEDHTPAVKKTKLDS